MARRHGPAFLIMRTQSKTLARFGELGPASWYMRIGYISKLEQGSKSGSSQPWYGGIIHERRTDPLLQYIHQARDASEHGDVLLGHDVVVRRMAPKKVSVFVTPDAMATGGPPAGSSMDLPQLRLLPVKTRSGTYPPPTKHHGQSISPAINAVAEATIAYLARVVADAKLRAV